MARQSLDLCCSEDSDGLCTPYYCPAIATAENVTARRTTPSNTAYCNELLSESQGIREDLAFMLLREHERPKPSNYLLRHDFMTPTIRQQLVAAIISVSLALNASQVALQVLMVLGLADLQHVRCCSLC